MWETGIEFNVLGMCSPFRNLVVLAQYWVFKPVTVDFTVINVNKVLLSLFLQLLNSEPFRK